MDDEAVQPFVDRNEYTFTVLHADEAVQSAYGVEIAQEIEKLLDEPAETAASSG